MLPRLRPRVSDAERDDASIDALVDEGMLIVAAALRLAVKNAIILRAVRDAEPYDRVALAAVVRAELASLRAEKLADARRLRKEAARAAWRWGRASRQDDYRRGDVGLLETRERISRGIAQRLDRLSRDDAYVDGILEAARDAALAELLGAGIVTATFAFQPDPRYEDERDSRLDLLRGDLERLARRRGAH